MQSEHTNWFVHCSDWISNYSRWRNSWRILSNLKDTSMDKNLIDGARRLFADELFETVRRCYCEANKNYLDKQIKIASEYMTDKQKEELRQKGVLI